MIVGTCGAVIYWAGQRTVQLQQIRDLDHLTGLVRPWLSGSEGGIAAEQRGRLESAAHVLNTRMTLIDGQGRVLFDSQASPEVMENHNGRPEVVEARHSSSHMGSIVRHSSTISEDAVYVAELVDAGKPQGMVVRLSYPKHTWVKLGTPVWVVLAASGGLAVLVIGLFGLLLQRQWIGPVRELARAAERLAAGQWDVRVAERGADDIRFFSTRLNLVAAHAERQVADLDAQRADLRALVDILPGPILVTDSQRRVTLINAPAARLLDLTPAQAVGKKVAAVVNEEPILRIFEEIQDRRRDSGGELPPFVQGQVRLNRGGQTATYQAFATLTAAGGVLLALRDISELASAMQMKTDFVANASHELRTPIAAIKVAFETLREVYQEDPPQTQRCLQIIEGHLYRLEEMLRDLLDLSRVESAQLQPHWSAVKTAGVYSLLRSSLGSLAAEKNVRMEFAPVASEAAELVTDERLLNLVLKNLVENSIKFTPAGGTVNVAIVRQNGSVVASVSDTGIGIPPEHVDRVFERFYQVNPARSGSAGRGTGLGLAIVKHAVAGLGGTVKLESAVGVGTTVTCVLPQEQAGRASSRSMSESV